MKVLSVCFLLHVSCRRNQYCVCVCVSYAGLVLMAAELSEHVLGMGGAHADLGETRQPLRRHIELGAHLQAGDKVALAVHSSANTFLR